MSVKKEDKFLLTLCFIYVFLPVYIFAIGWLNIYAAFATVLILSVCFRNLLLSVFYRRKGEGGGRNKNIFDAKYWFAAGCVVMFWVYISGIGGFVYQTSDFFVRNPIFRDLCNETWPVCYDLSYQSEFVQNIVGTEEVAFAYYFSFWLPAAFLSKIFNLSETGSNIVLYIWSCLGILLVLYLLNRYHGKTSYFTLWLLVCFSGLDVIGYFIRYGYVPIKDHMEWWGRYFQYSSNTTQLFWVFNQSIPIWIICALIIQFQEKRKIIGLSALVFAYSPWAAMGMIPIACSVLNVKEENLKEKTKKILMFENTALPVLLFVIYGTFYLANSNSVAEAGFLFAFNNGKESKIILHMLLFGVLEFGVYFFIMGKTQSKSPFYFAVLIELICFPFFHISAANDFVMRASIPALFFTMIYVGNFIELKDSSCAFRRKMMIVILCLGMWTPITEMNRNISNTLNSDQYIYDPVYSFGRMETADEGQIGIIRNQFFVYDYKEKFFFKWLSR